MSSELELSRPLVCLDLETTGTSKTLDRIIQVGLVKLYPSGETTDWQTLVNPTIPIPKESTAVHGITNEAVSGAPFFNSKEVAGVLAAGLADCDLAGYNIFAFDLPFLREEFKRCGIDPARVLAGTRVVDSFKIFQRYEPRTLPAAAKFYLDEEHVEAHSALGDAYMTLRVLEAQLRRYRELPRTVGGLHDYLFEQVKEGNVDPEGKIVLRDGIPVLNFSRHAGTPLYQVDDGFLRWALRQDFNPKLLEIFKNELIRRAQGAK